MDPKKAVIQNTLNIIFYEDPFIKTAFFTREITSWGIPIFYFDFDLQYTGLTNASKTPPIENLTLLYPENGSFREDLKSVIKQISKKRSLVIIDSLNGFFNILEGNKDLGRLINSFLMLLISSAKNTKSTIIVGALSKLNEENKWVLYNTGRSVIDNSHFTKTQISRKENSIIVKSLNSDTSNNQDLIL